MNEINELIKTIKQSKFKNKDDYLLSLVDIIIVLLSTVIL